MAETFRCSLTDRNPAKYQRSARDKRCCPLEEAPHRLSSPDRDLTLEFHTKAFANARACELDQSKHVAGRGAGMNNDVVGVAVADLGTADASTRESGLIDERRRVQTAGILEHARGRLKTQGLR